MQGSLLQGPGSISRSDETHLHTIDNTTYPDTVRKLLEKCKHLDLTERNVDIGRQVGHGGTSDLFLGSLSLENGKTCKVAVKKLRTHAMRTGNSEKTLARELYIWSKLDHPRILRLVGLYVDENYPCLISPWSTNGTVLNYLESNSTADVIQLVAGIAEGIAYLHARKIVHSDIKPIQQDNVLIDDAGEPLLCDFGISRILDKTATYPISNTTTTGGVRGTVRYMSKELFKENSTHTESSDIWAFGMTVYALLTGRQPYENLTTEVQVLLAIVDGKLPSCPEDIKVWATANQSLYRMCQRCWEEPLTRPDIDTLLRELRQMNREESRFTTNTNCIEQPPEQQRVERGFMTLIDETSLRRKFKAGGTAQHMSSDRLRCDFTVDGYRMTFDASTSSGLPQFSSKPVRIFYDDSDELTGTQGYSGFVGVDSYTLTLDNGTVIIGCLDASHRESMNRIIGSGIWIST
ncbi:hypothetical protein ACEPAH_9220 [Sanghuangporus vaninii]